MSAKKSSTERCEILSKAFRRCGFRWGVFGGITDSGELEIFKFWSDDDDIPFLADVESRLEHAFHPFEPVNKLPL